MTPVDRQARGDAIFKIENSAHERRLRAYDEFLVELTVKKRVY